MLKAILFSNEILFLLAEVEQVYHKLALTPALSRRERGLRLFY